MIVPLLLKRRIMAAVSGAQPAGVGGSRLRTGFVLLVATLLPLTIFALVSTAINLRDQQRATEAASLDRANRIADALDARLDVVTATMRALAMIRSIPEGDWMAARQRARDIAALDADWRNVALIRASNGTTIFQLHGGRPTTRATRASGPTSTGVSSMFSGVEAGGDNGASIQATLPIRVGSSANYLLQVTLDPALVQRILVAAAPRAGVSAVVDRRGVFIARTRAWPARLGAPATVYVRRAIASARSGIYRGVTYEGLENYSAFATSKRSGWSVHVALSSELIDAPQKGWRVAAGLAGLAGVGLAVGLVVLILWLVAARRAAEERAAQTERLEAIGKLTGGIAHDFNNMLAIVIGSLDLAQRRLAKGNADIVRNVDNAMDGARRAADLTRRLLAFSRLQPLAPAPTDVNALVRSTIELLRRTLPEDILIELRVQSDLWSTFVDPSQLENALVNLAVNARDAMPNGGSLTLSTANCEGLSTERPDRVAISITDTGTGMSAEVAARAFEPFFTTKEVGRGTGLGLSQIHGFATQSGGDATLSSRPGVGTEVCILLPRYDGPLPTRSAGMEQEAPTGRPEELILVVEDEEQVRQTSVEALRALGYTVRHAGGGAEAIAILNEQPGVQLMLTDIVMPGMNGHELARRVVRDHPDVRVLLTTGYDREQVDADEDRLLRKPFGVGELARRVRGELDRAESKPTES